MRWHSKESPFEHRTHFVSMDNADPLSFIGGGTVEYLHQVGAGPIRPWIYSDLRLENFNNPNVLSDAMSIFRQFDCRVKRSEA